jgi:hypothetical protein
VTETGQRGFGLGRPGGEQDLLAAPQRHRDSAPLIR